MTVFVYGTLKRGHRAHYRIAGQTYLESATTAAGYRLYDAGTFPGLVRDERGGVVHGELWEIDDPTLLALDKYEGVEEGMYERGVLPLSDGTPATTYLYLLTTQGLRDCGEAWTLEDESRGG